MSKGSVYVDTKLRRMKELLRILTYHETAIAISISMTCLKLKPK